MWRRNESAVISSSTVSPRSCQRASSTVAHEDLVLGVGRREGAEVVLADEHRAPTRSAAAGRAGAGARASGSTSNGERARAAPDAVAVRARAGGVAGVEARRRRLRRGRRRGRGEAPRSAPRRRAPAAGRPRPRPRRRSRAHGRRCRCARRRRAGPPTPYTAASASREHALDRALAGLARPAAKARCRRRRSLASDAHVRRVPDAHLSGLSLCSSSLHLTDTLYP